MKGIFPKIPQYLGTPPKNHLNPKPMSIDPELPLRWASGTSIISAGSVPAGGPAPWAVLTLFGF